MKVRYVDSHGCPVGNFVIEAESEQDRAIISQFIRFSERHGHGIWYFAIQNSTYESKYSESKTSSFTFGFKNRLPTPAHVKKGTLWQRIRRFWLWLGTEFS